MADKGFKRKLSAILSTDVVGYSRLMENNEEATIQSINAHRKSISTLVEQHSGRVVDTTGDNLMAEFSSVVDAVQCAVEIQKEISERNAGLPENRQMLFRIGVNLGDIIEEDDKIYGDGVNIAARLESLAEAGGICISGTTFDQIGKKLQLGYEYLGEQAVKNIEKPVRAYRVLMEPDAVGKIIGERKRSRVLKPMIIAATSSTVLLTFCAFVLYMIYFHLPSVTIASDTKIPKNLSKGPSIVVIPFENLSGDSNQDYFCDGLTESIITGISVNPKLFVIASHSSFNYKGKTVALQQVRKKLKVSYVLKGAVQKANDRVRITTQLVDAHTGNQIWEDKYDRKLENVFVLQDKIIIAIMRALEIQLTEGEQARYRLKDPGNVNAFMKFLKALEYWRAHNKESNIKARRDTEEAVSLVPDYAEAYVLLAMTYIFDLWYGIDNPIISLAQASKFIKKAISLDDKNPDAYIVLSSLFVMRKQHENSITASKKAVLLNPNGADAYLHLAFALYQSDRPVEALEMIRRAFQLNPMPPSQYHHIMGHIYVASERYAEALVSYKKASELEPNNRFAHIGIAITSSLLGLMNESRTAIKNVIRINPNFSIDDIEKSPNKNKNLTKRRADALRKVGLPE
jgi:adenylate cyclase